jgi:50S ribosomal protein L4
MKILNNAIYQYSILYKKVNYIRYASTKTKGNVRGGGHKPWKQKGTGRARAGSIRSPLWRGGGVCFGPIPRVPLVKINRKLKYLTKLSILFFKKHQISFLTSKGIKELQNKKTKRLLYKFFPTDSILIYSIHELNDNIIFKLLKKNIIFYLNDNMCN